MSALNITWVDAISYELSFKLFYSIIYPVSYRQNSISKIPLFFDRVKFIKMSIIINVNILQNFYSMAFCQMQYIIHFCITYLILYFAGELQRCSNWNSEFHLNFIGTLNFIWNKKVRLAIKWNNLTMERNIYAYNNIFNYYFYKYFKSVKYIKF